MDERVIHLEDGTTVSAKVNFAVLYYIQKFHLSELMEKEERSADEDMEACARMLHVLLLASGKQCSFEDALVLLPLDTDEFEAVFDDFREKMDKFKKKQESKAAARRFQEQK